MARDTVRIGVVADGYHRFTVGEDGSGDGVRLAAEAREAEELGYELFALSDHLHGSRPTFDPWTALTWVAASTTTLTVVTDVLGLPYRHPAVLAKMAESLDRLSASRLVLGIGNGGYDPEFTAFGLASRTPREKVDALAEGIEMMQALWGQTSASLSGDYYRIDAAQLSPPAARRVPVWVGGYGPRSLDTIGRLADGWLPSYARLGPDGSRDAIARVRSAATEAGRDAEALSLVTNISVDPGSRSAVRTADTLRDVSDLGFDTLLVSGLHTSGERRWFAEEVAPKVREY
ncbi:LLM class flavin-dependent oxidoreductase [Williamsia sterculiae]|uniref:Luciferase-like monooxygenase n=1 Tax=Williamsia sterculiae TaxID=1344003 RepID=A0A1N7DIS4_9NOCA|nr:LLM class flavin-dependent oxidoreductase [Williamsia sterculiae]SIR75759.1 Luciferase-like monooxygenase [Williamsia sterculiae]